MKKICFLEVYFGRGLARWQDCDGEFDGQTMVPSEIRGVVSCYLSRNKCIFRQMLLYRISTPEDCDENIIIFALSYLQGVPTLLDKLVPEEEEEEEEEEERREGERQGDCFDGEDNDGDGYIDCDDQGCGDKPACQDDTGWVQPEFWRRY